MDLFIDEFFSFVNLSMFIVQRTYQHTKNIIANNNCM